MNDLEDIKRRLELLYLLHYTETNKIGAIMYFRLRTRGPAPRAVVEGVQKLLGYEPHGYGIYGLGQRIAKDSNGEDYYVTTWHCYTSCD